MSYSLFLGLWHGAEWLSLADICAFRWTERSIHTPLIARESNGLPEYLPMGKFG
jgi:hypothetical protein